MKATGNALGEHVVYAELNAKQKEIYNFQKVAGLLADHGFNCIKLTDDWKGADFLADHFANELTLRVQLKSCLTVDMKYVGKELFMAFPVDNVWYLLPHDILLDLVGAHTNALNTVGWTKKGLFWTSTPNAALRTSISDYEITAPQDVPASTIDAGVVSPSGVYVRVGREVLGPLAQKDAALALVAGVVEVGGVDMKALVELLGSSVLRSTAGFQAGDDLWTLLVREQGLGSRTHWFIDSPIYAEGRTWVLQSNVWSKRKLKKLDVLESLSGGAVGLVDAGNE